MRKGEINKIEPNFIIFWCPCKFKNNESHYRIKVILDYDGADRLSGEATASCSRGGKARDAHSMEPLELGTRKSPTPNPVGREGAWAPAQNCSCPIAALLSSWGSRKPLTPAGLKVPAPACYPLLTPDTCSMVGLGETPPSNQGRPEAWRLNCRFRGKSAAWNENFIDDHSANWMELFPDLSMVTMDQSAYTSFTRIKTPDTARLTHSSR